MTRLSYSRPCSGAAGWQGRLDCALGGWDWADLGQGRLGAAGLGAGLAGRGVGAVLGAGAEAGHKPRHGMQAGVKKAVRQEADPARRASSLEDVWKIVSNATAPWPPPYPPSRASGSGATEPMTPPRSKRLGTSTQNTAAKSAKSDQPERSNILQTRKNGHGSATNQSATHGKWASESDVLNLVRQLPDHDTHVDENLDDLTGL